MYVDTCVLSDTTDSRDVINEATIDAIDLICDNANIDLVTSKKTLEEFLNTVNKKRRVGLKLLYRLISKVPSEKLITYKPAMFGTFSFGRAVLGGHVSRTNPLYANLKQIFDKADAEHIFQAVKSNCQYFLTVDERTILKRARENNDKIKLICPNIKFVNPVELVNVIKQGGE